MTPTEDNHVAFLKAKLATEVGPHEARELVDEGRAILLDVRSEASRAQGHIPGSLHIPRRDLAGRVKEVPRDKVVVAYCSDIGCQASLKATIELRSQGIDARHLIGGYRFWQEKGYPTAGNGARTPVTVPGSTK